MRAQPGQENGPVDDAGFVQPLDSLDNLRRVEPSAIAAQPPPACQLRRQVPTIVEVEREVESLGVVERVVQPDDERVRLVAGAALEDLLLRDCVLELPMGQDMSLVDRLKREELARVASSDEQDLPSVSPVQLRGGNTLPAQPLPSTLIISNESMFRGRSLELVLSRRGAFSSLDGTTIVRLSRDRCCA